MVCFFKQKTAYVMRISDGSSDVCSSDLVSSRRATYCAAPVAFSESDSTSRLSAPAIAVCSTTSRLPPLRPRGSRRCFADRKSVVQGQRVSVRVDLGGRRIIKKQSKYNYTGPRNYEHKTS